MVDSSVDATNQRRQQKSAGGRPSQPSGATSADAADRTETARESEPRLDRPTAERPPREAPAPEPASDASKQPEGQTTRDGEPGHDEEHHARKRTRWPLIALIVLVVVAGLGFALYWFLTRDEETTDDAYTDGRAVLIAPHVAGYVKVLAINDNEFVHAGDLLVEINPKDFIAARDQAAGHLSATEAQLDAARIALQKAQTLYPAQLTQAQGRVEQARGQLFQAQRDSERQKSLSSFATTQSSRDAATASLKEAEGQMQQAQAQLRQAQLVQQDVAQAQTRVKQLEGQVEAARGNLAQANINLGYTRVTAPQDGWVTKRNVEMGDYLQPGGQILAIVVPQVWVTANFKETKLDRIHPGERVTIHVDGYPQLKLEGHVDSIQKGSGTKFSAFPPENATGNFVKIVQRVPVKIIIDKGLDPHLQLPLGLSAEPTVYLK